MKGRGVGWHRIRGYNPTMRPARGPGSILIFPGAMLCAFLGAALGCGSGSGVANRLQERLKDLVDTGRPDVSADEIEAALAHQLRAAPVPAKGANRPSSPAFPTRQTLREFYAQRGQKLAWCGESGRVLAAADTLLDALSRSGDHGLNPEDYELSRLERMRGGMKEARAKAAVSEWADFDLLLTTAFFRYGSDLSTGRVHPDEIRSEWHAEPPELDLPKALETALQNGDLAKLLEKLPPPHPGYARLQLGLKQLRDAKEAGGWPAIPAGPKLQKGARGPRVALLRQRLEGGAAKPASPGGADAVFDAALEEKVRQFQTAHGLEPDGRVSEATLAELNVPVERRIRQVELNLERWRWMPRRLGDPHLEVNIPGFDLQLLRGDRTELRSRIVVGQAFTPTPVFSDRIVAVIANPPWNVPDALAVREYLPELRENPAVFQSHGIKIYDGEGEDAHEVDPASVHWGRVDDDEFHYHLRQDPGPDNALGRMKFQLTNDFQIYLHDTPARTLFAQQDRDLSHGCIRVEKARELADTVLGEATEKLTEALQNENEKSIPVRPPVPVHILYLTAWADADGGLRFAPDIYDFDAAQMTALDRASRQASLLSRPGGQKTSQ
ncbi:MAG TPA: L,D-transpeptidase family protein [Candidatus Polarisedimenticolia bacterium]|nr:L,D-transpeptidase family protein [Candidatus Polarisedimenticolia bacterium]